MKNLNEISDFEKLFDWKGVILSTATWGLLKDLLISLVIAFVGGFLAAAGKGFWTWCNKKKKQKDVPD